VVGVGNRGWEPARKKVGKHENVISGRNREIENTAKCFTIARANGMMVGIAKEGNWDRGIGYRKREVQTPWLAPPPSPFPT